MGAVVLCLAGVLACSKKDEPKPAADLSRGPRVLPGSTPAAPPPPEEPTAAPLAVAPGHDPVIWDGAPLAYTVTQTVDASTVTVDSDLAVVAAARAEGVGCFSGLPEQAQRSAVIRVTVVPSGSVSRTEVSSDPEVKDCLTRVGDGLRFSDKSGGNNAGAGIRSFSIDVSVALHH